MSPRQQAVNTLGILAIVSLLASCSPPQAPTQVLPEPAASRLPPTSTTLPSTPTAPPPSATPRPPTPTAPEPYAVVKEAQEIIGTWKFSESDFTRFYEDGTMHDAYSLAQLDDDPFAVNTYEFEEAKLILRELSVSGIPSCGGKVGTYEIRLLQSGNLQIVVIKDSCGPRAGDTHGIYKHVP
jgi:hypothetical protein